jgi:hypothetical protein
MGRVIKRDLTITVETPSLMSKFFFFEDNDEVTMTKIFVKGREKPYRHIGESEPEGMSEFLDGEWF